ncbi:arylsulfatase [Stratiformator vulcanicus]|nr:arylsulfatase [Stratiformator vulcanicus]
MNSLMAEQAARPNVILVMTDDQGWGDFGATGNELIRTPNLDEFATSGAWMTDFYVSPVCTPTRASLMTGRWNFRTKAIDTYLGRAMMDTDEVTIAELLRDAGYATGIFGKWHLGDNYPLRPMDQGFGESLVHRGGGLAQPGDPIENEGRYTDPVLVNNGVLTPTNGYCTDVYFNSATDFIRKSVEADRPFFTYIATNAPHGPYYDVPKGWLDYYQTVDMTSIMKYWSAERHKNREAEHEKLRRIAAMISNVDENFGRLLQRLDRLGVADNTLIIFLTDNGPNTMRYAGPFRGMKSDTFEGGVRTVMWLRWPERIRPGIKSDAPTAHVDVLPTILEAAGIEKPDALALDGRSFLPIVEGRDSEFDFNSRPIALQWHRGDEPQMYNHFLIRKGRWKLLNPDRFRGNSPSLDQIPLRLHDLKEDPGETRNLIENHPEIANELRADYEEWFSDVSSTRDENYAPPRIVIDLKRESPVTLTRQDWRDAGWQKFDRGRWVVDIKDGGPFDVLVTYSPSETDRAVEITVDGETIAQATTDRARPNREWNQVTLKGVELPTGKHSLAAAIVGENGTNPHGVFQMQFSTSPEH